MLPPHNHSNGDGEDMEIKGTSVLVTGASRGLGKCIAEELLARGAARVYCAAPDSGSLEAMVSAHPARVVPLALDITDEQQVHEAAEAASDVSLVFNNAGVMALGTPLDADLNLVERDMRVNYLGTLLVTRAFAPVLERHGGGAFVNIISLLGLAPVTGMSPYCASKAASHSLTQALRHELAGKGIAVMGVYPGGLNTDMLAGVDAPKAEPTDVARAILDAVESGNQEDITPDQFSSDAYAGWRADPKSLERQLAAF
jgi:NAD(P)-dependent dehydrogenase (short-subunit alcohol dehydrogenase family)